MRVSKKAVLARFDALAEQIGTPERWSQLGNRLPDGRIEAVGDPSRAVAWCVLGALVATSPSPGSSRPDPAGMRVFNALTDEVAPLTLTLWNDTKGRQHAEVMALIARARANVGRTAPGRQEGGQG